MQFYRSGILAFGPDGRWIASRDEDEAEILDLNDGVKGLRVVRLQGHGSFNDVTTAAFSPDGRLLASADEHANIIIWDVSTGHMLRRLTGHTDGVNSIAFSPDGNRLASGSGDNTVRIWEVATGNEIRRW